MATPLAISGGGGALLYFFFYFVFALILVSKLIWAVINGTFTREVVGCWFVIYSHVKLFSIFFLLCLHDNNNIQKNKETQKLNKTSGNLKIAKK